MGIVGLDLDILVTIEGLQCYDRIYYEDNDLKLRTCGVKQSIVAVSGGFLCFFMENHIYVLILWYVMVIQLSPQFFLLLFELCLLKRKLCFCVMWTEKYVKEYFL